jgi:hypothetical protein
MACSVEPGMLPAPYPCRTARPPVRPRYARTRPPAFQAINLSNRGATAWHE